MALRTLANLRDECRRLLAIMTALDAGTGSTGDPVSSQPDPLNVVINSAINQAIEALNRVVRVGPFIEYPLTVAAATARKRSTFWVSVQSLLPPGGGVFHTSEIEELTWTDANGNTNRLQPFQYYSGGKGYTQFQAYKPGTPTQFITSGFQIGLLPPPDAAGTLTFTAASGIPALIADTDVPDLLPDDYEFALVYWAVMLLSAREAQSVEAQSRYPLFKEQAAQAFLQVYQWKNGFDDSGIEVVRNVLMMTPQNIQQLRSAPQPPQSGNGQ